MATVNKAFLDKFMAIERRNERTSAIVTVIIMLAILSFILIRLLYLSFDLEIGAGDKYEVVGSIDFGNRTNGSKKINNFKPPTENPSPVVTKENTPPPPTQTQTEPEPTPPPAATNTKPADVVTQNTESEVKAPPPSPKPKPTTTTKPKPTEADNTKPTTTNNNNTPSSNQPPDDGLDFNMGGGSNEGDADSGTGNQGTPDTKVLDPDGLFSFDKTGPGSLKGRTPLSLDPPRYTTQEEGEIRFKVIIGANGSVVFAGPAGPIGPNQSSLVKSGRSAIMKWKFSKGSRQTVYVSILFKLK